ncbi:MAG: helix-turn-helix domain-containing protein [Kangiellaceae bacterium]|nr:helix-turn-helix domain-containing protein [Kangiellaceae bacterium]MCW8997234.1 helix-turn-helix domain-containing protein [Kangiellaceae bacterium]
MSVSSEKVVELRRQRGWSQEKLAAICGLSERTIQRIEKDGNCSLDSKVALATAFDVSPAELSKNEDKAPINQEVGFRTDWSGAFGLFILGLAIPAVVLLTGTNGKWELASFAIVIGLTVCLSIMTFGASKTYQLFDKTSWIVKYPSYAPNLSELIMQSKVTINNAYIVGCVASLVTGITLAIHSPESFGSTSMAVAIILKPLIYAVIFVEFWFRPFKRKMEKMLTEQMARSDNSI